MLCVANGSGAGIWKQRLVKIQATLTPASVAASTTVQQTFTFTGAILASDTVIGISKPTTQAGLGICGWRVTADNTIGIAFINATIGAIVPTAGEVYTAVLYRA